MSQTYDVRAMLDIGDKVAYEGEGISTEDLDLHEIENALEMVKVYRQAVIQLASAKAVTATCGKRLAQLVGEGGAARVGNNLVRYHKGYDEKCIDPEGFMQAVTFAVKGNSINLTNLFNANYAKKGGMTEAMRDTFFEKVNHEDATLTIVPRDRAPKFLQYLEDGEVLSKKGEHQ